MQQQKEQSKQNCNINKEEEEGEDNTDDLLLRFDILISYYGYIPDTEILAEPFLKLKIMLRPT